MEMVINRSGQKRRWTPVRLDANRPLSGSWPETALEEMGPRLQESLSPDTVGIFGVLVVAASLLKQQTILK